MRYAEGFKRGRYGARLETSAHIVETLGNIDVLRAVTRAFAAFNAVAHQLGSLVRTALAVKYCDRPVNQLCA